MSTTPFEEEGDHHPHQNFSMQQSLIQVEFNRGLELHLRGQFAEAEKIYKSILKTEPKHFDAAHLLGVIALQRGPRGIDDEAAE